MNLYKACQAIQIRQKHWHGTVVGIPYATMSDHTHRLCGEGYTPEEAIANLSNVISGQCSERCNQGTIGCDRENAEICQSKGEVKTERIPIQLNRLEKLSIKVSDIIAYAKWRLSEND